VNIPIQNIYYLLCYAWDKLEEKEVVDVDPIESTSLADLFARVLISGTNHLVKRGFDRGYVAEHEWTGRLRGRILFQKAIRMNRMKSGRLPCSFDQLSYDVLHNQILKATMRRLIRSQKVAAESSEGLAQLCRLFSEIRDIELTNRVFGQVQLYRNNQFYDFLLRVCQLIHANMLVSERAGTSKLMDFVRDERQMRVLFEDFVRNFYRINTDYKVKREDIYWRWIAADQVAEGLLPKMQTDISLTSKIRKIIIDCKYTPEAVKPHFGAERLRSSHLFQIHAYMDNLPHDTLSDTCEMILLYPTTETPLSAAYAHRAHKIYIRTIDLDQPWQSIHNDLLALVA
jgi:5-methylcytosine-specific restriction enzyme subunit McrC